MLRRPQLYIKSGAVLFLAFFILSEGVRAQYSISATLTNTYDSGVNWVDLDGDGDLDLSVSGSDLFLLSGQGKLYLNSSGTLTYKRDIRPMLLGDQVWSDFNNDGYPDLLYAGTNQENVEPTAGIDVFSNFTSYDYSGLPGDFIPVYNGIADWGDYDNDGDFDVLICGEDASGNVITRLYSNDAGTFSVVSTNLPGIINGKAAFVDYDLDQDLDIFLTGRDINSNKYTRLWENTGGLFSITDDHFINLEYSQFDWGDYNGDGYPDLLLGGYDNTSGRGLLYINNSGNNFTLSDLKVPLAQRGTSAFGDVDNDGDLDAFVSGYKVSPLVQDKYVFINNGTDSLVPSSFTSTYVSRSHFNFGDYDNDNDLDFVSNGADEYFQGVTIIAQNLTGSPNQKPSAPQNLSAVVEGTSVRLMWNHSTDDNTPQKSLTYNIYIGTVSGGSDIVSPNSDISTGFRRISRQGYIRDTAWIIKELPVGTYYWGVQSIDNSFGASSFSSESTFEIKERFTEIPYGESTIETSPAIYFDCDHDNDLDMVLNTINEFSIAENQSGFFSEANYNTILSDGYNPITTITPFDYNNDNLIDFSVSGNYTVNGLLDSTIALFGYKNPFEYDITDSSLIRDVAFEYVLWADLNNDGRQDAVTSGMTTNLGVNNEPVTYILQNISEGVFQEVNHSIRGFEKCNAVAGDFDNDLDIDLIIYGKDSQGIPNTYIYFNEGEFNFNEVLIPDNELFRPYLSFGIMAGDYDLNGELDIYMQGVNLLNDNYARVLLNDNKNFTDANLQIRSAYKMSGFWADYDYDGDLDIFSTTLYNPPNKTWLYLNNNGILDEITIDLGDNHRLDLPFMAANLDNMNGLDFIMKINYGNYIQYHDNWGSNDRITSAPSNTQYDQDQLDIILKWDKIPDCPACTYNIRVGTTPGGVDIMSPMSDLSTGYRYVVQPGNAYLNDSWKLCDLPVGKYYWSVQAVDPANTGGPWSPVDTFTVSLIDTDFSFTTECRGDSTEFTDMSVSTENITGWKWIFGDGESSTQQHPKHLYVNSGIFDVGLWAYSESGDSAYQEYEVSVKAVPDADFTVDTACQGTATTFTNNTSPNGTTILTWLWNFGDGESSTLEDPETHGYINSGDYEVNLVATADNGCVDYITKTATVSAYPVTLVTADAPLTFCKGDSVILSVPYNSTYNYNWMIGGTSITGGDTSNYIARQSGNYSVEAINPVGDCRDTSSIVIVNVNDSPVAPLISVNGDIEFCQDDSVILSVTNNSEYSYQWKLNGGAVGIDSSRYIAKSSGTYSLTVSNSTGCSVDATNTLTVTVNPSPTLPVVNISGSTTFCQGDSVVMDVTFNPAYSYQWQNNGIAITGALTNTYTAKTTGSYSLKITNTDACSIETEDYSINTLASPSAPLISADGNTEFCEGGSVILSVTNNSDYKYDWKLNGGAVGSDTSRYVAAATGEYSLTVSYSTGCSVDATNTIDVTVNPTPTLPTVNISGPTTFCEGDSVILSVAENTSYTYQWENNNSLITGATSNTYKAVASDTYKLNISNSYGCVTMTSPVNVTVKPMPYEPVITSDNYVAGECMGETPVMLYVEQEIQGYTYQWYRNGIPIAGETSSYIEDFLTEGDYSLEVDLDGCTAESDVMTVYFEDAPDKPFLYAQGPTVWYLTCSNDSAKTYRWYCNGNLIEGADDYYYIAGRKMGDYQVSIGNELGCFTRSDIVNIPTGDVGIDDIDPFEGLKIYPNPTTGSFTIEMDNNIFGKLLIRIVGQDGKELIDFMFEKTSTHFIAELNISEQPDGYYLILFDLNKHITVRRIIID